MVDIYIIGTGILSSLQLTREALQAAAQCRKLFVLHDDPEVIRELSRHCAEVYDLFELYRTEPQSTRRDQVYTRISSLVLQEAASKNGTVGLAVHGNPMFLVSAVENIVAAARRSGLLVRIVPGVSSFDTIQCDLGLDLGYGVQILDCTTMVNLGVSLENKLPALIFQLATYQNAHVVEGEVDNGTLEPLVRYLERFYPPEHVCTVVLSSTAVYERPEHIEVPLHGLHQSTAFALRHRPTLFIPAMPA